jgi:hypothetical protein
MAPEFQEDPEIRVVLDAFEHCFRKSVASELGLDTETSPRIITIQLARDDS